MRHHQEPQSLNYESKFCFSCVSYQKLIDIAKTYEEAIKSKQIEQYRLKAMEYEMNSFAKNQISEL